ncbi:hypothetical protein AVEN_268339-1 [Araneus ventricosus]|uniref:Uncharacterized protein n=1 Tax=Araneus ventricosus TaxID=182803 RepID=A0A4Y2TER1_ARAVE|nr:hypothetical protein AVEN_268339-1 [Araneus ventricosus]
MSVCWCSTVAVGRSDLVVRCQFWAGGFQARNPIPLKIRSVMGLLPAKSYIATKLPPVGVAWKFGEGVPSQVSSSSSDCVSKLRGPSQNSPRVASKRDANILKTKSTGRPSATM